MWLQRTYSLWHVLASLGRRGGNFSKWPASSTGTRAQWPSVQSGSQGHVCPKSPHPGFVLLKLQAGLNYHVNYQRVRIWNLLLNFSLLKFHPSYFYLNSKAPSDLVHWTPCLNKKNNFPWPQNNSPGTDQGHICIRICGNHSKKKKGKQVVFLCKNTLEQPLPKTWFEAKMASSSLRSSHSPFI